MKRRREMEGIGREGRDGAGERKESGEGEGGRR